MQGITRKEAEAAKLIADTINQIRGQALNNSGENEPENVAKQMADIINQRRDSK